MYQTISGALMTSIIFCGPSLPREAGLELFPGATFLPPAACGDIYRIAKQHPRAIGLIDGYFDHSLAVWHKELLWAMSKGIALFGAASMGALRAAELDSCGMRGIGNVYEQYRVGVLEDDDEVAVLHEPATNDYRLSSHAMVNIRATLGAARAQGVIDSKTEAAVIRGGKSLFYADRTFGHAVRAIAAELVDGGSALLDWFRIHGLVDEKQEDAKLLVRHMKAYEQREDLPPESRSRFFTTNFWDAFVKSMEASETELTSRSGTSSSGEASSPTLLDEVSHKLPELRDEVELTAVERALALELAKQQGFVPSDGAVQEKLHAFLTERGLKSKSDVANWLLVNELQEYELKALMMEEVQLDRFALEAGRLAQRQVPSILRLLDLYPEVVPNAVLSQSSVSFEPTAVPKPNASTAKQ